MNFVKKGFNFLKGDDEKANSVDFETTKWAECIVTGTDDDKLIMNGDAMKSIRENFHDVVSLVGPPGVGKSTLASTMYNVLRGNKDEYFEASDCMEGFTKGIWTLRRDVKVRHNDKDRINILDLEGLEDEDIIHYFVVVAMALSKSILLCANYAGSPRFKFDVFKTLQSGIRIYKQNNIRVPTPIIYVQVPTDKKTGKAMTQFKLRKGTVDQNGLVDAIKKKFKELEDFEIRVFALPSFGDNGRFDKKYLAEINALINELEAIDEKIRIENRVHYAKGVALALNKGSPSMVTDMNLKFFKLEIEKRSASIKASSITQLRAKAKSVQIQKVIQYTEFCQLITAGGKYRYGKMVQTQAMSLAYYEADNSQHNKIVQRFDDEKMYYIETKDQCKDIYETAMSKLKSKMATKGEQLMTMNNDAFNSFVDLEIEQAANGIKYNGNTSMPYALKSKVHEKARQLKSEVIQKTQNLVKVPSDYLSMDILTKKWNTKVADLKSNWNRQKQRALVERRKVMTSGEPKCPSCGTVGGEGICHKECPKSKGGKGTIYYWVDGPTRTVVCDMCEETRTVGSGVCCYDCSTTLPGVRIIAM